MAVFGGNYRPIDRLRPNSAEHAKLLEYLKKRLKSSERKMEDFYPRWRVNERKVQAYVTLPDYEQILRDQNDRSKKPKQVSIVVPYTFAIVQTVVTYLIHTFCGRQPIFQVSSYNNANVQNARNMELVLQYNADHSKLVNQIYAMLLSSQVYQFGVLRVGWSEEYREQTSWQNVEQWSFLGMPIGTKTISTRARQMVYSGNEVVHVDPFMFFPDPRVPMVDVAKKGEFCFWRSFENEMGMRTKEQQGLYSWTRNVPEMAADRESGRGNSDRGIRAMGESLAGHNYQGRSDEQLPKMVQIDEGTINLVPADFGLSSRAYPEKWLFTIANKAQIVRAEPLEADHDMHPVAVIEPNAMGSMFGSLALADIIGPIQDLISWLINSHMQSVRTVINNKIVVNPHYVEMKDLKSDDEDGSFIVRMKQSAFGVKPSDGLYQLNVHDVTAGHLANMESMMRIGYMFAGVNENILGQQDSGGRKTATEVRTSGEAGASRLAAQARLISAQGLGDLPVMMAMNLQQRMNPEFYQRMLGERAEHPLNPMNLAGDFYFPINDGTLPLDRAALMQVWQQILMGVAQDQELRANYSLPKLFAYVAELGGARNIDSFKVNAVPDAAVEAQMQAGNVVPLPVPGGTQAA